MGQHRGCGAGLGPARRPAAHPACVAAPGRRCGGRDHGRPDHAPVPGAARSLHDRRRAALRPRGRDPRSRGGPALHSAVVERSSGRLVGSATLHLGGDPEVGYWVAPAARGQGYATEAAGHARRLGVRHRHPPGAAAVRRAQPRLGADRARRRVPVRGRRPRRRDRRRRRRCARAPGRPGDVRPAAGRSAAGRSRRPSPLCRAAGCPTGSSCCARPGRTTRSGWPRPTTS